MVKKPVINMRETIPEDSPFISKWLLQKNVLEGFPMIDRREVDDAVRLWMQYIEKRTTITVLYKKKPCGAANLYISPVEKLKHQCLFVVVVDEAYRGQGVGTILIRELERRAKNRFGIEILHLEAYENNPAVRLYKRLGFVEYGKHPHFLKDPSGKYYDKVFMQKKL